MWGVQVQTQAEEDQILAGTMCVPTLGWRDWGPLDGRRGPLALHLGVRALPDRSDGCVTLEAPA